MNSGRSVNAGRSKRRLFSQLRQPFRTLRLAATCLLYLLFVHSILADQSVTLAWDPNVDAAVAGYRIHYGPGFRDYTNSLDVKANITATVTGLREGIVYHFAVTAYAVDGLESLPSDEVIYRVPGFPDSQPLLSQTETVVHAEPDGPAMVPTTYQVVHTDPVPALIPVSLQGFVPKLEISAIGSPPMAVQIHFESSADNLWELQTTEDLKIWESLMFFESHSDSGPLEYVDWTGDGDKKFYRLVMW
jgi:hypothetical protein